MEDSRKDKGDGEKGLSMPSPHVDGENGKKAIVYNTKEEKKERERKKDRKNCVLSSHNTRAGLRILFVLI